VVEVGSTTSVSREYFTNTALMLDLIKYPNRINKALDFYTTSISSTLWLTASISVLFFLTSSLKHVLFLSSAWDMGIFDQAVYLISQGQEPISSFMRFHVLGDHAAFILYPLALLHLLAICSTSDRISKRDYSNLVLSAVCRFNDFSVEMGDLNLLALSGAV
jgi:hypothetical protein